MSVAHISRHSPYESAHKVIDTHVAISEALKKKMSMTAEEEANYQTTHKKYQAHNDRLNATHAELRALQAKYEQLYPEESELTIISDILYCGDGYTYCLF